MALKGNLQDFTLAQLLNLINLAHKTGTLVVESPNESVWVFFRGGKLAYAQTGNEDGSLINILHRTNRLTTAQYRGIRARINGMNDKELGLLLINANYFTQQDILTSLQSYFIDTVRRLFTWINSPFHFENDLFPPDDKITVRVNLENIILESSRQVREMEQLNDEIPSLEMALKFADRPNTNIHNLTLSSEEWRVVNFINPKNTIRQIALATNLSDLDIRQIAYGLIQAGLVELTKPAGSPTPSLIGGRTSLPMTTTQKTERVSLINRIINRIRSL